jgi:hypothetical protein
MAKRSCDPENREESRLGDSKPKHKSSQLDDGKNEPPKLKLYNLKFEQQKIIGTIHSYTFPERNVAGVELRSAEKELATLVESFYHSINPLLKGDLNKEAKTRGFKNFLMFFHMNPTLARTILTKKFPLAGSINQADNGSLPAPGNKVGMPVSITQEASSPCGVVR